MPPPIPLHQLPAKPAGDAPVPPGRKPSLDDLEEALGEDPAQRGARLQKLFAVFDESAGRTGSVDRAALEAGFDSLVSSKHLNIAIIAGPSIVMQSALREGSKAEDSLLCRS